MATKKQTEEVKETVVEEKKTTTKKSTTKTSAKKETAGKTDKVAEKKTTTKKPATKTSAKKETVEKTDKVAEKKTSTKKPATKTSTKKETAEKTDKVAKKKTSTQKETVENTIKTVPEEKPEQKKRGPKPKTEKIEKVAEPLAEEPENKKEEKITDSPKETVKELVKDKKRSSKKKEKVPKKEKKNKQNKKSKKEVLPEEVETFSEVLEKTMPKRRRYTSRNTRRGRHHFAAWLGLVILLLAIIGMVYLVLTSIAIFQKANDHTDQIEELYDIAYPLIQYQPTDFASLEEADQSVLLQSAIFRITENERVRQAKEKTDEYAYELDKYGRLIISVDEINNSFETMFGDSITPKHQTLGESSGAAYTFEYDKANACYHVPFSVSSSMYTFKADKYRVAHGIISIRVGYALTSNLDVDNHGNPKEPTDSQMEYYQWYSFERTAESVYHIVAISSENKPAGKQTTTQATNEKESKTTVKNEATKTTK